jgi:hypothetical protein
MPQPWLSQPLPFVCGVWCEVHTAKHTAAATNTHAVQEWWHAQMVHGMCVLCHLAVAAAVPEYGIIEVLTWAGQASHQPLGPALLSPAWLLQLAGHSLGAAQGLH